MTFTFRSWQHADEHYIINPQLRRDDSQNVSKIVHVQSNEFQKEPEDHFLGK